MKAPGNRQPTTTENSEPISSAIVKYNYQVEKTKQKTILGGKWTQLYSINISTHPPRLSSWTSSVLWKGVGWVDEQMKVLVIEKYLNTSKITTWVVVQMYHCGCGINLCQLFLLVPLTMYRSLRWWSLRNPGMAGGVASMATRFFLFFIGQYGNK